MTTINFKVGVKPGTLDGYIDGFHGAVGVYTAENASLPLYTSDIFCVSPDSEALTSMSSYTVQPGVVGQTPFTLTQIHAIEGVISQYYALGNTSPTSMAQTVLANWIIVNPNLVITGMNATLVAHAHTEAQQALAGQLGISSTLKFSTFVNANSQNFVNVSPVPLPASGVLLFAALMITLLAVQMRKTFFARAD